MLLYKHSQERLKTNKDGNMIPVIDLKNGATVDMQGRAWKINFVGKTNRDAVYVGGSVGKIENGKFWVKEFVVAPNTNLERARRANWLPTCGTFIAPTPIETQAIEATPRTPETRPAVIHKGFFTVESPIDSRHRTFRIKTGRNGKTVIGLLTGSNNLSDYTWFGFINGEHIKFWQNAYFGYGNPVNLQVDKRELQECFGAITGNTSEAGLRFSREHGICSRCGKLLTHPESLDIGLGPECSGLGYTAKPKKNALQQALR